MAYKQSTPFICGASQFQLPVHGGSRSGTTGGPGGELGSAAAEHNEAKNARIIHSLAIRQTRGT